MLESAETTGSITSSSSSASRRSASGVNPEMSANSAVTSRRSSTGLSSLVAAGAAAPQWPQKRVPPGFSPPHAGQLQVTMPAVYGRYPHSRLDIQVIKSYLDRMSDRAAKQALFDAFASVAAALGSGRRAEIVDVLAQGERSVDEIAADVGQSL